MRTLAYVVVTVLFLVVGSYAADYKSMTTEQLMALRGTLPVEERPAFRAEMQNRFKTMSAEERKAYGVGQGLGGQPKGGGPGFAGGSKGMGPKGNRAQ